MKTLAVLLLNRRSLMMMFLIVYVFLNNILIEPFLTDSLLRPLLTSIFRPLCLGWQPKFSVLLMLLIVCKKNWKNGTPRRTKTPPLKVLSLSLTVSGKYFESYFVYLLIFLEKLLFFNTTNVQVAILCNHQRTVSKTHEAQMLKIDDQVCVFLNPWNSFTHTYFV